MIRIVVFIALLGLFTVTVAGLPAPGFAEDGKGVFSFFNGNKNSEGDQNKATSPVFMKPQPGNAGRGNAQKPYDMSGGKSSVKVARYEDSSIFEDSRQASANLEAWTVSEAAVAESNAQRAVAQMMMESQRASDLAREEQLRVMAMSENLPVPQSAVQNAAPLPQSIVNPNTTPQAVVPEEEPTKRKPRQFFNRPE